ncbi:Helitron helicase [Phytophthora megakarya]|uniref:Helitron helicase n=1 Tax=Phytophthora megakarya TaxID=4795 RepID=A0A225UW89_9STRA|nr:Helitron helicase [Phytophthora megakarya]
MYRHKIPIASIFGFYFAIVVLLSRTKASGGSVTLFTPHFVMLHLLLYLTEAAAEKMSYQLRQHFAIVLEEFKAQMSEDFVRNFEEKDTTENIHREGEIRARMAEYKELKYLAHYLASNGKILKVYGLPELRAYSDVSAEVDGPTTESIVQQELNAYSQTDLEHVTERVD